MNLSRFKGAFQVIVITLLVQFVILKSGVLMRLGNFSMATNDRTLNSGTASKPSTFDNQQAILPLASSGDPKQLAYETALKRFQERRLRFQFRDLKEQYPGKEKVVNSMRIPKAGSSHLSVIARALAGCLPDGFPCCAKNDKRTCLRTDLLCNDLVLECVNHIPNFYGVVDRRRRTEHNVSNVPIITSFRYPSERLLSAYFYGKPHSIISPGENHTWEIFESMVASPFHQNIMVKMLTNQSIPMTHKFDPEIHTIQAAQDRVCTSIEWFHMNDLPLLSAILLYEREAFRALVPNPVVFGLPADNSTGLQPPPQQREIEMLQRKNRSAALRVNAKPEYETFKTETYVEKNGDALVKQYNQADLELYEFVLDLFCAQCIEAGILDLAISFAPKEVAICKQRQNLRSVDYYCPTSSII